MTTLLITFGIFMIVILLMAIGVILNKKTIKGSCGGLSNVGVDKACNCEETCDEHKLYQISEPGEQDK
ncbi:(Na+)-NQR maturation NqrM [Vibrio sp. SCSIO 43137]|uniref:(Na+)-NQR maturation NqrM n=1 Tax=Vibrio sp. SCSIO 43137 TaxID=3021011 RepID=UPI00230821C2|nr:(Na+)-NQR maturation NqrM [Vibrio sp. SCSIO 43137]WCE30311.1 (Na+)-NQR maturation NqrM [Vibrio sp. SCSIO 43137]